MQYLGVRCNIYVIVFPNGDEIYVGMIAIHKQMTNRTLTDRTGHSRIE